MPGTGINTFSPAFIVPRYGTGVVGGAEELARKTAGELARRGIEVTVLTTCALDHHTWQDHYPPGTCVDNGVRVMRFPGRTRLGEPGLARLTAAICGGEDVTREDQEAWFSGVVSSPELVRHLEREGSRYSHLLFLPYLYGTTFLGTRVRPDRSWILPCLHDEPFAWLPAVKDMLSSVAGLIFNSPGERRLASRVLEKEDPGPAVGMGFYPGEGNAASFRNRFPVRGDFVLYAGRREEGKNTPLLVEYFRRFAAERPGLASLVLVGSGKVDIPADSLLLVHDLGRLPEAAKSDAFAAASVFCTPSVNESLSIVLMESWLAGRPALVNRHCEVTCEHVTRSGGGLSFGNYHEFAACLEMLLGNPGLADKLGSAGRSYVFREYNWDSVIQRLLDALEVNAG